MWRELLGLERKTNGLVEVITPRRSFNDVILPPETRQQLYEALTNIQKHRLIYTEWGLGERHPTGMGLVFNFAGPPGTGKTICAEAVAYALGRKLLRVRYSELESCWVGETGKNIRAVFREAGQQDAVLFFDEADSIAARRFANVSVGYEREANQAVNILLKEVEEHAGVVIFATNMASNFDPAFERRIRTHILFRIPSADERERIWRVQIHPQKTPLGDDVDFRALAERFDVAGGDIRNAVLKAAEIAAAEEGPDEGKRIGQQHLILAMEQVLAAKTVMQQNAVAVEPPGSPWQDAVRAAEHRLSALDDDIAACRTELEFVAATQTTQQEALSRLEQQTLTGLASVREAWEATQQELGTARDEVRKIDASVSDLRTSVTRETEARQTALQRREEEQRTALQNLSDQLEVRLARVTLLPWPKHVTAAIGAVLALVLFLLGGAGGYWLR